MRISLMSVSLSLCLCAYTPANGQDAQSIAAFLRTIETSVPIHFVDTEQQDVMVPAGSYYVHDAADGSTLQLLRLDDGETFSVAATKEEYPDQVDQVMALSIPATDEQPDVHTLTLLYRDNTQLVAIGSYSGFQTRGLCGPVCQAAKKKAEQAAREAKKRAAEAAEQARRAAALAEQRAQEAAGNLAGAVAGGMQELVEITTELELKELLVCLSNSPSDSRLGKTVSQVTSDPAAYIRSINRKLETRLAESIPATVQQAIQDGASNGQIINRAINRFDSILKGHAGTRCLMAYVEGQGVDWKARARKSANSTIENVQSEADELLNEKIIPAVTSGLAEKIGDALDGKGFKTESVATALFVKALSNELEKSNATIKSALATDVDSRNSARITAAISDITDFPDKIVLRFGYELLRARGHTFIDKSDAPGGDWAADQIKDAYIAGMDGVNEVGGALCGLIPEVGGIICAPISYVARIVYAKIVGRILKKKLVEFMHDRFDIAMDRGWKAIENNTDPDKVWRDAGPFGIVLQGYTRETILKMANDEIGPFRDRLVEHNELVSELITDYAAAN